MTAEEIGRSCPICDGTDGWRSEKNGKVVEVVRCINCLGSGLTDAGSLYKSPISHKVAAKYGPGAAF